MRTTSSLVALVLMTFAFQLKAQLNCQFAVQSVTPVPGNPLEYTINFTLTTNQPLNGSISILAVNPNGGNITSSPLATPVNVGAGTHQQSIKVVATSPIPVNTPISTSFSGGVRGCASTLSVSFPQPIPECFRLRTNAMTCQPGAKLRMSHALDGISGNGVNGTLVITATGATFSAPSAGGTLNNPNQLTFSVGNPTGGTFNFEYDLQHNPANGTPQLTFEFKAANGQTLCASRQDIRPYPSLCGSSNRCNKVNITFSNPAIPQVPGFVLSGIATTSPLSETFFTQLTISLINFERRTECPNSNPGPWQSLMQNPPIIQPSGMTNACVEVSNTPTVVNTPVANSIQFTTNNPKQQANANFEHFLQFRGVPEKQSGNCPERLRITLRYFFRNNKGCEVEMYRIAEVVR